VTRESRHMQRAVDAVIFVPFADGELEMAVDTIDSIRHYVREPHHIIAYDDATKDRLDLELQSRARGVTVLRNTRKHGGRSGLYVTMAQACKYAMERFKFSVFLKMDTDALMVGPGLIGEAIDYFDAHPDVGILGSYRVRADGKQRRWYAWKWALVYESSPLRRVFGKSVLWRARIREARGRGYELGENVLGGAFLLRYELLEILRERGDLDYRYDEVLSQSRICDDVIFSLFCRACGYKIGDFGGPGQSMALALDRLPLAKEEVLAHGKSIIHSLKQGKDGESQAELRSFFRAHRSAQGLRSS